MADLNALLNILRLNGVNQLSSQQQVELILNALKYSPEEKQEAFAYLRNQGWTLSQTIEPAPHIEPATQSAEALQVPIQSVQVSPTPPQSAVVSASATVGEPTPMAQVSQQHSRKRIVIYTVIGILVVAVVSIALLYLDTSGFFVKSSYTENNLLSGLLAKSAQINSSSYESSVSIDVVARDPDASPFVFQVANEAALQAQYQNDVKRATDVSTILSDLRYSYGAVTSYVYDPTTGTEKAALTAGKPYPASLNAIKTVNSSLYSGTSQLRTSDPVTAQSYQYTATDGGKNFALVVNFDTDSAIAQIRGSYGFVATTTIVNAHQVTFTKDSPEYLYLSSELPSPFLVQIGESARFLPNDVSAKASFGGTADWSSTVSDWLFNIMASGSFGDLTYAVDLEARKKDGDYYFIINKIPSLFGEISLVKGKWIKVSPESASSTTSATNFDELSWLASGISTEETAYKENREKFVRALNEIVAIADENKVIAFKDTPRKETINGQTLIGYDLSIRKDSIIPFYTKLLDESATDTDLSFFADAGTLDYLKSAEFDSVFDYLNANTFITLWVDGNGFPAIIETRFRVVPPDTATQFKDKQVNLVFELTLADINKPVVIEVPSNATPIQQVIDEMQANEQGSPTAQDAGADATIQANLANTRTLAQLYYDNNQSTFGTPSNVCGGGMFSGDPAIAKAITAANAASGAVATCHSTAQSWAISSPLKTAGLGNWCVDDTGASISTKTDLVGTVCK